MSQLYVYELPEIDSIPLQGLMTVGSHLKAAAEKVDHKKGADGFEFMLKRWRQAQLAATKHGWDGSFNGPPRFIMIPAPSHLAIVYVWETNFSSTIAVSGYELPHLDYGNTTTMELPLEPITDDDLVAEDYLSDEQIDFD